MIKGILIDVINRYLTESIIILGVLFFLFLFVRRKISRAFSQWHAIRRLRKKLWDFTPQEIRRGITYYIWPDCQSIDPAYKKDSQNTFAVRNSLQTIIDEIFNRDSIHKHIILLADTGMGKTSFLLNYFACYLKRWRHPFHMEFISLTFSGLEDRLKSISKPENAILLLDAFDEDPHTIQDRSRRFSEIINCTNHFHRVLMTCRTSFFIPGEEITEETKIQEEALNVSEKVGELGFYKLYLSPFSDLQIQSYLKRRFSSLNKTHREKAQDILDQFPYLSTRPILLNFLDDLVDCGKSFKDLYQIYDEILNAWLDREKKGIANKEVLRRFIKKVAVKLFADHEKRGRERIPFIEVEPVAKQFGIDLASWKMSERALLNRDVEGNYRFVHHSILEFLFAQQIINNDEDALKVPVKSWTSLVKSFLLDGLDKKPWRFPIYFVPYEAAAMQMGETGKTVTIKPFEMSIYPVTNREYEEFDPSHRSMRNEYSDKDDQPIVNISWEEADRYCKWLSEQMGENYRLPTEEEWEFAAGGIGKRTYPWGNEKPTIERANFIDSKVMKTTSVDSYPLGMTPEGLFNMAGNVWEWCDDWYNKKQKFRIIRGGSFFDLEHYLRCVFRLGADMDDRTNYISFRVVRGV